MMIPITRKEKYINQIVGGGDTAPETPQTREEFFFADILGEVVAPSPVTRIEKYLSAIAGQYSGDLPTPATRIEYFLARAAGMDVETPTPITREEIFWSNYTAIVEFELEGVPPLAYKAIEGTLKNYSIYGNTVDGESVGDLITEGEHAGEYKVPVTVSNGTDTLTTPIYLPEQIRKVGDEAEYIDYGGQKQHRVRKNLLPKITATYSRSGILLESESDGTVSVNGTATKTVFLRLRSDVVYPFNTILSGCAQGGSREGYYLRAQSMLQNLYYDYGNGALIPANTQVFIEIRIQKGTECNNLKFKPMIRKADIEDDTYEPYIENTDLDVTLPALPTVTGTNVLSVGTEVQPSMIYVKGKKERE
jgi:hypothetical protein